MDRLPCPWHLNYTCEECVAKEPCEACRSGQNAQISKRRFVLLPSGEAPVWTALQPVTVSSPADTPEGQGHSCGCLRFKPGQRFTDSYFHRHFERRLRRRGRESNWVITHSLLKIHQVPGACFVYTKPELWVSRCTVATPWRIVPQGVDHSFRTDLEFPIRPSPTFKLHATKGEMLHPFQITLVNEMIKRGSREDIHTLVYSSLLRQPLGNGKRETFVSRLPATSPGTSLVCTLSTPAQLKRSIEWLMNRLELIPGGFLKLPHGYGKRVVAATLLSVSLPATSPPAMVICENADLGRWKRCLETWAPNLKIHLMLSGRCSVDLSALRKAHQLRSSKPSVIVISASKLVRRRASFETFPLSTLILDKCHTLNAASTTFALIRSLNVGQFWGLSSDPGDDAWRLMTRCSSSVAGRLPLDLMTLFTIEPATLFYNPVIPKRKRSGETALVHTPVPFLAAVEVKTLMREVVLTSQEMERYRRGVRSWSINLPSSESYSALKQKFLNLLFCIGPYPLLDINLSMDEAFYRLHVPSSATETGDSSCPICRETVLVSPIQVTPCHHRYCMECLKGWWCGPRSSRVDCPVCRATITGFMFENPDDMRLAPRDLFPLGCEAKLREVTKVVKGLAKEEALVIASISPVVLATVGGWLDGKLATPFTEITSRASSSVSRSLRPFLDGKVSILLVPYGHLQSEREFSLNLDGKIVHKIVFMEPEGLTPPGWRASLVNALTPFHNPDKPKSIETIDLVTQDTLETSPFIEKVQGSGYSMRFLEAALTTIRVLANGPQ